MTIAPSGRVRVDSTTLAAVSYDGARLQLDFLDGTRYAYSGASPELFRDLLGATSKGSFFNRHIRGRFPCARLTAEN
jgi:KTSC domain